MSMYMSIPGIKGSVTAKRYQNWIPLLAMNWQAGRHIETPVGRTTDRVRSIASGTEMQVIKPMDQSSPLLFNQSCIGKAIPTVEIHAGSTGAQGFTPYLQYKLSDVIISEYQTEIGANTFPEELFALNFTCIETCYTPNSMQDQCGPPQRVQMQLGCQMSLGCYVRRQITYRTPNEFNLFVATVYGETAGTKQGHETAWKAVGSVIINRIHSGIWHRYYSADDIITHTGFDAFTNPNKIDWNHVNFNNKHTRNHQQFLKAWATLNGQQINNHDAMTRNEAILLRKMGNALQDIYNGYAITIANYYYSPRSMHGKQPGFLSHLKNPEQYEVFVPGINHNDFKFYYIPAQAERSAGNKPTLKKPVPAHHSTHSQKHK